MKKLLSILLCAAFLALSFAGCNDKPVPTDDSSAVTTPSETAESSETPAPAPVIEPAPPPREYRTQIKGNGEDVVTLMVYLCGSDLESRGGAATIDLVEMISADIGENLNVVIETGGAMKWATDIMNPALNQRWQARDNDIFLLEESEAKNMSDGDTLKDFITYSAEAFPADRYMLVLWDHGGGTVGGYAYDERYEDNSLMTLADLDSALGGAGVEFDMIGFDCCLMGTAETAFVSEKHADYMIASQRVEPGNGWYYTDWINALSENPSIPTEDLGKLIVDTFLESNAGGYYGSELTLSVLDLTHIPGLFHTMGGLFSKVQPTMIHDGMFISASHTLGGSRAMQEDVDLVDISVLAADMDGSGAVQKKLDECVVYNGATIDDYNGLCFYIPYTDLYQVEKALDIYEQIGIDQQYRDFVGSFANLMLGGQMHNSDGSVSSGGDVAEDDEYGGLGYLAERSWADESEWDAMAGFFEENAFTADGWLATEWKEVSWGGSEPIEQWVVPISDKQWELITDTQEVLGIMDADGSGGFLIMGSDISFPPSDDNDLVVAYDFCWPALNGHTVCFYLDGDEDIDVDEDTWYRYGHVPVLFAGESAELIIYWDNRDAELRDGVVVGWRFTDPEMGSQKGLFAVEDGMTFEFVADHHDSDGIYTDTHVFDSLTVDGPIKVTYMYTGDHEANVYYELTDLFNNLYMTEAAWWDPHLEGGYLIEDPDVIELKEKINKAAYGEAEGQQRFYYASTDEESILLVHDIVISECGLFRGEETTDGNAITITDKESGESFTFTPSLSQNGEISMETAEYGQVVLTECEPFEAAKAFVGIPEISNHLGFREERLEKIRAGEYQ